MSINDYLDPATSPCERPPRSEMAAFTRELHDGLDAHAREENIAWLHPLERSIQRDLLGSPNVVSWQEAKAAFLMVGDGAWSQLPHLYARYGTPGAVALIDALRTLEAARCAMVTDSGMQALALIADVIVTPGSHGILMRQLYNKTKTYFHWIANRVGGTITLVDDGDLEAIRAAITPATTYLIAETYTNPLMRAQDVPALRSMLPASAHLVIDSTIATPWAFATPLLQRGATVVTGSLTKALGGRDLALGGYVATNDTELGNAIMDLIAMRGGILDDGRCNQIVDHLEFSNVEHIQRCVTATHIAEFLARHPSIEQTFHPSLPGHPDAAVIARDYQRPGSIVSFRVRDLNEAGHRHLADVLVTCGVPRYALSFDGLATKVNHHQTVSEYFTPADQLAKLGIDRLIRLGVGLEEPADLIACLNWALHNAPSITTAELDTWRTARAAELTLR